MLGWMKRGKREDRTKERPTPEHPRQSYKPLPYYQSERLAGRWAWSDDLAIFVKRMPAEADPKSAEDQEWLSDYQMCQAQGTKMLGYAVPHFGFQFHSKATFKAIEKSISLTPNDDLAERPQLLRRLSKRNVLLEVRYLFRGDMEDLKKAIPSAEQVAELTPQSDLARPHRITTLANLLTYRFERTGNQEDIDRAIQFADEALQFADAMKAGDEENLKEALLRNLAIKLDLRYQRIGSLSDLEEAISRLEEALKTIKKAHPDKLLFMSERGNMLASRFQRMKNPSDLDEAILVIKLAAAAMQEGSIARPKLLDDLGNQYLKRYQLVGNMADLDLAIKNAEKAFKAQAQAVLLAHHPDIGKYLNSLAQKLTIRAKKTGESLHLAHMLKVAKSALHYMPEGHPNQAEALEVLGDAMAVKNDMRKAVELYLKGAKLENAHPLTRIKIFKRLGDIAMGNSDWKTAGVMFSSAINIWPRLNPRALSREDMEYMIRKLSGLGSTAAFCIIEGGGPAENALLALESGRGIITGLGIDSRSDISRLKTEDEKLYNQYIQPRDTVASPLLITDESKEISKASIATAISRRNQENRELEQCEAEIRSLPSKKFNRFQLPQVASDLTDLAKLGSIVCFNVTEHNSCAFIVAAFPARIESIPLTNLKYQDVQQYVNLLVRGKSLTSGGLRTAPERNEKIRTILKWLWQCAVEPVLSHLKLISSEAPKRLPRIWWVTSGLLGLLPLHAAGSDWKTTRDNTMSHVVSSYVPTFKALAYAREKKIKSLAKLGQDLLIVSMPVTEGFGKLKVEKEVNAVLGKYKPPVEHMNSPSPKDVLEKLKSASIAHFICHGISEALNPSNSALILNGGHLTVRDLAAVSLKQAQIAYLSACSTAQNQAEELVDESIHIASAFHLVGFPHVIATLWLASNAVAEKVAPRFYEFLNETLKKREDNDALKNEEDDNDAVAYALHEAVQSLWDVSSDIVVKWALFIHIGA